MTAEAIAARAPSIPGWTVAADGASLSRRFRTADFAGALAIVDRVAALAEREDHHPDIAFGWGYASFTLSTHSIGGLHENDFIIAEGIDAIAAGLEENSR
jgi:4a-hydroxytetrahydrobiopterin dehydratase